MLKKRQVWSFNKRNVKLQNVKKINWWSQSYVCINNGGTLII